jgi:hypothetical protein
VISVTSPPDAPLAESPLHTRALTYLFAVALGLTPAPFAFVGAGLGGMLGAFLSVLGLLALAASVVGAVTFTRRAGRRGARYARQLVVGALFLVALPVFGLLLNAAADPCTTNQCDPNFRPLSSPEVYGLIPLHVVSVVAYFIHARRSESLGPRAEAVVGAALLAGVVLQLVLAVQFAPAVPLIIFVITAPVLTPYVSVFLFASAFLGRLRARGEETAAAIAARSAREAEEAARIAAGQAPVYRRPAEPDAPVEGVAHEPSNPLHGLLGLPVLLGAHAVLNAAIFASPTGGVDTFLHTCGYPLSQLAKPPPRDCHYLCTVAAQGSPGLVRPLRWGVRRGRPIVVNRQLALANAFEDLLHERWPAFGRFARRVYDALAFPLSQHLTRRWMANALYLAMKPAELVFVVALLLFDPRDPEERVERMYR